MALTVRLKKVWKTPRMTSISTEPEVLLLVCTPPLGPNLCASGECVTDCATCLDNSTCGPG